MLTGGVTSIQAHGPLSVPVQKDHRCRVVSGRRENVDLSPLRSVASFLAAISNLHSRDMGA